ncbi:MAG: DMT family transporter [Deltaproteobacteria bacterium]|nr:DMT family transporter [Deltaproteobacteria bacterium]
MAVLRSTLPSLSLLAAMTLWASSFIALKLAFQFYHPMFVIFGRMLVASIVFLFFFRQFWGVRLRRADFPFLLVMAVSEPCLYFLFEAKALENTTASQAGMITAMLPLMVAIGAHFFLREKISRRTVGGFVLAIIGAVLLSLAGDASATAPRPLWGNFCEFLAMACATVYTLALKRLTSSYSPFFLTAFQAFIGSLFFFPFLLFIPEGVPPALALLPTLAVLYLGVFVTLGAYGLYNFAVSRIPANQAAAYVNLIPVLTLVLAWLVLHENFTPFQYVAGGLVFLGVFLSQDRHFGEAAIKPGDVLVG